MRGILNFQRLAQKVVSSVRITNLVRAQSHWRGYDVSFPVYRENLQKELISLRESLKTPSGYEWEGFATYRIEEIEAKLANPSLEFEFEKKKMAHAAKDPTITYAEFETYADRVAAQIEQQRVREEVGKTAAYLSKIKPRDFGKPFTPIRHYSPFTGSYVPSDTVVAKLLNLQKQGITKGPILPPFTATDNEARAKIFEAVDGHYELSAPAISAIAEKMFLDWKTEKRKHDAIAEEDDRRPETVAPYDSWNG